MSKYKVIFAVSINFELSTFLGRIIAPVIYHTDMFMKNITGIIIHVKFLKIFIKYTVSSVCYINKEYIIVIIF